MLLDGGVVFIAMVIVVVIAFIKGLMYGKSEDKDSAFRGKYSDEDIRKFEDMLRDLQKTKKR